MVEFRKYFGMKNILFLMILLTSISISQQLYDQDRIQQSQTFQFDNIGIDTSLLLNPHESGFLNEIFKGEQDGFNFNNKKVGFIKASGENGKIKYFEMQKKHFVDKDYPCDNGTLYIFKGAHKKESGGCDAAIVY
jgi:hypothetical protein